MIIKTIDVGMVGTFVLGDIPVLVQVISSYGDKVCVGIQRPPEVKVYRPDELAGVIDMNKYKEGKRNGKSES